LTRAFTIPQPQYTNYNIVGISFYVDAPSVGIQLYRRTLSVTVTSVGIELYERTLLFRRIVRW
jgi:hypothetical protein